MNEDIFDAVVARNAMRAMRLPGFAAPAPSVASTTRTTPLDATSRIYGTSPAAQDMAVAAGGLSGWKALATLHSFPTVFLVGLDGAVPDEIHSRVQQYVERRSVQPAGLYSSPDRYVFLVDHGNPTAEAVSVFASEDMLVASEARSAPFAFNCVELVEERDVRVQKLLAEVQNGAAHGRATVQRLRELADAANEEGEPFSVDALEGLAMFANAHPSMPMPELTLSGTGGIVAEWQRPSVSVTLYFATPISVQYLIKQRNPLHRQLVERSSGTTTVDRVGNTLKDLLSPSAWPIRA